MQRLRYLVLGLIALSLYSNNFVFDLPALIKQDLMKHFTPIYGPEMTQFYFSFLYSFYSIPNIILPLFGGVLCDKYGYRSMSMIFIMLISAGQFTIYMGCSKNDMQLMILGRFLYGMGGESLGISSSMMAFAWFSGKELSFANSLIFSLVRTANVLSTLLTPKIAASKDMTHVFGFGFLLTLLSLTAQVLLNKVDSKQYPQLQSQNEQSLDFFETVSQIQVKMKQFPRIYWYLATLIMCFNACIFNFISFSGPIITDLWLPASNTLEQNETITGRLMGIPHFCCTIMSPLIGLYIDQHGNRTQLILTSCSFLFIGLVALLYFYPIVTMTLMGLGFSIFASSVWTTVTYLVPSRELGVAYGVITSMSNLGSVIVPLMVAIIANFGSAVTITLFFIILSLITISLALEVYQEDKHRKVSLDEKDQTKLVDYLQSQQITDEKQNYDSFGTSQ